MKKEALVDNMTTLLTNLKKAQRDGFIKDFIINENGLSWSGGNQFYTSEEVVIVDYFRYEGKSDPDENAILYFMETKDGNRGSFSAAYGVYADPVATTFIQKIEEIMKQNTTGGEKKE